MTCLDAQRKKQENLTLSGAPKTPVTRRLLCVEGRAERTAAGPTGLAAWRRVPGTQALVGGPAVGVLRPVGGARARGPSPPAARALACRPAAHVFLFCVVAFVLEARIYILSVSGEWAGALVPAGERRSRRPVFSIAPPPFSHHSNQVGAGNLQGPVCRVWESFFFLFFSPPPPHPNEKGFKKNQNAGEGGVGNGMNKKGKEGGSTWFNRRQTEIPLFKINKKKKKADGASVGQRGPGRGPTKVPLSARARRCLGPGWGDGGPRVARGVGRGEGAAGGAAHAAPRSPPPPRRQPVCIVRPCLRSPRPCPGRRGRPGRSRVRATALRARGLGGAAAPRAGSASGPSAAAVAAAAAAAATRTARSWTGLPAAASAQPGRRRRAKRAARPRLSRSPSTPRSAS